jgi:hypothetical protein
MPKSVQVLNQDIRLQPVSGSDYICLTDIARHKDEKRTDYLISNWLRNRNTIEFLGLWEQINNPSFNPIEFDGIKSQAVLNSFILTAKQCIESTGAVGLQAKAGRYGGTYAHADIAFEFAAWISVEFKLYLIKKATFATKPPAPSSFASPTSKTSTPYLSANPCLNPNASPGSTRSPSNR